jgi:hypothetical protein
MKTVLMLFLDPIGQRVFKNVLTNGALADANTVLELEDIAPCLTANGWPCVLVTHKILTNKGVRTAYGLEFPDEQAYTAFVLRWGG